MSGPARVKSMNHDEGEARSVLAPAGNQARSVDPARKHTIEKPRAEKTHKPLERSLSLTEETIVPAQLGLGKNVLRAAAILRQNLSLNASSCSSDASSDSSSSQSRPSTGGIRSSSSRRKILKKERQVKEGTLGGSESEGVGTKKRCAWVTINSDPLYTAFHDEEWGFPVHDDKKLFELLSFSTALAELAWPVILSKRTVFRELFMDFDPIAVSKLNEKKVLSLSRQASSVLSELKLRSIIDNARQICKIINEFGTFDEYIWSFVNHKPIVGNFRYPRQVPIKTSKAEAISKELVRRGFRGVGPTVVYSFMQASGMTNDHLISCFRCQDCVRAADYRDNSESVKCSSNGEGDTDEHLSELGSVRDVIDDLSLSR